MAGARTACPYCGRPSPSGYVCRECKPLHNADPLGPSARKPVTEDELLGGRFPPATRHGGLRDRRGRFTLPGT